MSITPIASSETLDRDNWYYLPGDTQDPTNTSYQPRNPFSTVDGVSANVLTFWTTNTTKMLSYKNALSGVVTLTFKILPGGKGSAVAPIKLANNFGSQVFGINSSYGLAPTAKILIQTSTTGHTKTDTWATVKTITQPEFDAVTWTTITATITGSNIYIAIRQDETIANFGGWAIADLTLQYTSFDDLQNSTLRGFLIPLNIDQNNIDLTDSSFTQSGNFAGDPIPQQSSALVLRSTGEQTAGSDLQIKTINTGHAGVNGMFVWSDNAASSGDFGRDMPAHITSYDHVKTGSTTNYYLYPQGITLDNGSLLIVAYTKKSTDLTPKIRQYVRSEDSDTYTETTIYSFGTLVSTQDMRTAICKLSNGNLLLLITVNDYTLGATTSNLNIISFISTDNGDNWNLYSNKCIDTTITLGSSGSTYQLKGLQVASIAGQVLCTVETFFNTATNAQNRLFQFASIDGGATFTRVTTTNDFAQGYLSFTLQTRKNIFVMSYIADVNESHYLTIPHAFYSIQAARNSGFNTDQTGSTIVATGSSTAMATGEMCMCVDDNNNIYIYYKYAASTFLSSYSTDGLEFNRFGKTLLTSQFYNTTDTTGDDEAPKNINCVINAGRVALLHNCVSGLNNDDSLNVLYLGGYSTLTMPYLDTVKNTYLKAKFSTTYIPYNTPSNVSMFTVSGSGTDSINAGRLKTQTTAAQQRIYTQTFTTSMTQGVIVRARFEADTGGATNNDNRIIDIKLGDGSSERFLRLRISTTQMQLYDVAATANIGTAININGVVDVIIAVANNNVNLWYFVDDTVFNRAYVNAIDASGLGDAGAGVTGASVVFGHRTATSDVITYWHEFHVASASNTGQQMATTAPDLSGMIYPPTGEFVYIADGVKISTLDGPAVIDDEYQITTRYNFAIDKMFYHNDPSMVSGWRSAAVTSGSVPSQQFVFDSINNMLGNPISNHAIIAIHLHGLNTHRFKIFTKSGSGSYTLVSAINSGITFRYRKRAGAVIVADVDQTGPYINYNEFQNCVIQLNDSTAETTTYTRIKHHTAGAIHHSSTAVKTPVFYVDEDFSDTSADANDQAATIVPANITILIHLGENLDYDKIKIEFMQKTTQENYLECSHMSIGHVIVPGQQYGRGRTISRNSGTVNEQLLNGTNYARNFAESKRTVRLSWSDPIDLRSMQGDDVTPVAIMPDLVDTSIPITSVADVPYMMQGILKTLQGELTPLVYLPKISATATTTPPFVQVFNRSAEQMLSLLQGDVSIESVIGDELENESFRVSTIVLKEL